ncbi:MAG: CAP domain-containing protein [bacterium]|nr:CAP domain-containing protein [bacterium]
MRIRVVFFILVLLASCCCISAELEPVEGVKDLDFLTDMEKEVIEELNIARTDPEEYAEYMEEFKRFYQGNYVLIGGRTPITTHEGVSAVNEAIEFLKERKPLPALRVSRGLSMASKAHVADLGSKGTIGHSGTDKSSPQQRMNRFGKWKRAAGENICYFWKEPRYIVMQLIIDDNVPNRGHRTNIFNELYNIVGVSCGAHKSYGWMCTMDFAGGYTEKNPRDY